MTKIEISYSASFEAIIAKKPTNEKSSFISKVIILQPESMAKMSSTKRECALANEEGEAGEESESLIITVISSAVITLAKALEMLLVVRNIE